MSDVAVIYDKAIALYDDFVRTFRCVDDPTRIVDEEAEQAFHALCFLISECSLLKDWDQGTDEPTEDLHHI